MPYKWLTPNSDPGTTRQIILVVPADDEFEAIVRGALLPLLDADNFEQYGDLTPDETVAILLPAVLDTLQWIEP